MRGRGYPKSMSGEQKKEILKIRKKAREKVQRDIARKAAFVKKLLSIKKDRRPSVFVHLKPAGVNFESGLITALGKDSFKIQKECNAERVVINLRDVEKIKIQSTLDLVADVTLLRKVLARQQDAMRQVVNILGKNF